MNENKNDNEIEVTKSNKIPRESLLDDQFNENSLNNLLLCKGENNDKTTKLSSTPKLNSKKPHIHRSLISNSSTEKYREFLAKIEKSNQDINNRDSESVRIDKDMLNPPDDNSDKACVVMDVSMGIFDVCNENLNDSNFRDMNITISEVINQEPNDQCGKDLIQEI